MQIKDVGMHPAINGATRRDEAAKRMNGESFLQLMQERIKPERQDAVAEPAESAQVAGGVGEIEAIAARSRIIRTPAGGDVTGFLELIKENRHLLRGIDVNVIGLDENTDGTGELTPEQASALRQEYNTENLTQDEQKRLFKELNALGVLSASDVKNTQLSVTPSDGDLMDYLAGEPGFKSVSAAAETDPKARLDIMIQNERYAAHHVQKRYGQNVTSVSNLADSHEKVLNVLKQI